MNRSISLLFTLIYLLLSNSIVDAYYSNEYQSGQMELILTYPAKAIEKSLADLKQAQIENSVENQLIAYLYLANATITQSDEQKAREYTLNGLKLAKDSNNIGLHAEFLMELSYLQDMTGEFDQGLKSANLSLEKAKTSQDERLIAKAYSARSQVELSMDLLDLSMKDVEKTLEIVKRNNDSFQITANYNLLAIIYDAYGDFENALKYSFEAIKSDKIQSPYNLSATYYNIAAMYMGNDEYNKAEEYFNKSRKFSLLINDDYALAFVNFGMADLYMYKKQYDKAESFIKKTFTPFQNNNDNLMLFNCQLLMVDLLIQKKSFNEAEEYLNKSKILQNKLATPTTKLNYLKQKEELYKAQKKWREAYKVLQKVEEYRVDGFAKEKEIAIAEVTNRINVKFNQEKITLLEKQNELQSQAIQSGKIKQRYSTALIGLIMLVLLFTYIGYAKQRKLKRQLFKLSHTDYLTNVSNRRFIMLELQKQFELSTTQKSSFALIMMDLDFFKIINDTFGHSTGNEVLKHFAQTAKYIFKDIGKVGRIGGEEWLVIVPETDETQVKEKLNQLRECYKNNKTNYIPQECNLSFSSGITFYNDNYENYEKMLSDVDVVMYEAKRKGREQDIFV